MSEPRNWARFTPSAPFDSFLETMVIYDETEDRDNPVLMLSCIECSEVLCKVESDDSLGVLVRTALAHDLECEARDPIQPIQQGATRSTESTSTDPTESE